MAKDTSISPTLKNSEPKTCRAEKSRGHSILAQEGYKTQYHTERTMPSFSIRTTVYTQEEKSVDRSHEAGEKETPQTQQKKMYTRKVLKLFSSIIMLYYSWPEFKKTSYL